MKCSLCGLETPELSMPTKINGRLYRFCKELKPCLIRYDENLVKRGYPSNKWRE